MSVKTLTVEFVFEEEYDEVEEYTSLTLSGISADANFSQEERDGIAEGWAQSDFYWVGITGAILDAIGGDIVEREDIKW